MIYDIIIIGSGISGLYTAYNIKKMSPNTRVLILEKYKKNGSVVELVMKPIMEPKLLQVRV